MRLILLASTVMKHLSSISHHSMQIAYCDAKLLLDTKNHRRYVRNRITATTAVQRGAHDSFTQHPRRYRTI